MCRTQCFDDSLNYEFKLAVARDAPPHCSAVEADKVACKTAEALADQCRYMRSINEEPSELAEEALQECVRSGYLPNVNHEFRGK